MILIFFNSRNLFLNQFFFSLKLNRLWKKGSAWKRREKKMKWTAKSCCRRTIVIRFYLIISTHTRAYRWHENSNDKLIISIIVIVCPWKLINWTFAACTALDKNENLYADFCAAHGMWQKWTWSYTWSLITLSNEHRPKNESLQINHLHL